MTSHDDPYRPPSASVERALDEDSDRYGPDGDLDLALTGEIRLPFGEVVSEAWDRVRGMKMMSFIVLSLLVSIYSFAIVAGVAGGVALSGGLSFSSPEQLSLELMELSTKPAYSLTIGVVMVPFNALLYLGFWNLGLRRAGGRELGIGDGFPFHALGRACMVMLLFLPVSLLSLVHPLLSYTSMLVVFALFWTLPLLLDRDASVGQALRQSLTLARYNWAPMLGLGLLSLLAYLGTACTCYVGLIWFGPFFCNLLGVSWRRLCGVRLGG